MNVKDLAREAFCRALEDDNLVRAGPADQAGGVRFAGPFAEDLHLGPDQRHVLGLGMLVHQSEQVLVALFFDPLRELKGVIHLRCRGATALAVAEDEAFSNCTRSQSARVSW